MDGYIYTKEMIVAVVPWSLIIGVAMYNELNNILMLRNRD